MTRDPPGQRFLTCAAAAALLLIASWTSMATTAGRHVSNLNGNCMRCLCYASTLCNMTVGCSRGYCGPYYLYRDYWKDAGQLVVQDDDPDRDQAFVDCASNMDCAQKVVENYMVKWGRDCNKDGVTDCDDYARIHFNGREDCSAIDNTNYWRRYVTCRPVNGRGLDPAFPLYMWTGKMGHLTPSDAEFVDVIHTDGGVFGFPVALGHADFFPNGGFPLQPGCTLQELAKANLITRIMACSHDRAWEYFAESVINPIGFPSLRCLNYESFTNGTCFRDFAYAKEQKVQYMGLAVNKQIRGQFYLATKPTAPFAYNKIYKP